MFDFIQFIQLYPKAFFLISTSLILFGWVNYIVFFKNNFKYKIYKIYALYAFFSIIWVLSNAYFQSPLLMEFGKLTAIKMAKFANIVSCLTGITAFYFSCLFKADAPIKTWEKIFIVFIILETFILNLIPNLTIVDVIISYPAKFQIIQGDFTPLFFGIGFIVLLLTIRNFIITTKTKLKVKKQQTYYMLLGISCLLSSIIIFHVLLPVLFNKYNYVWLPPLFTLAEIALFGYALLTRLFYGPKHMLQRVLAYGTNGAVYLMPLIISVIICNNNSAIAKPTIQILIYSAIFLTHCLFNKKSFRFFDRLFNLFIYKSPMNKTQQIQKLIKEMPETKTGIEKWLKRLQDVLEVKGAEFAFAQDASFKSFSDYFENDYSKCLIKETLDYKIESIWAKTGKQDNLPI